MGDTIHNHKAFVEAFAKAQAEMQNAHVNQENSHFRNKYADLASIRDATVPILSKHGIAVSQTTEVRDGAFLLVTRLLHPEGMVESIFPLPQGEKMQQIGSALTYAKRYSLAAICCISAEADDDGNEAQEAGPAVLPKKDAKPIYSELIAEMRKQPNVERLLAWKDANKAKIDALPDDWFRTFKQDYQELGAKLKRAAEAPTLDKPGVAFKDPAAAQSFDAQKPAANGNGIPPENYDGMIEDWVARLKDASPDIQAEIWETEIAVRIEDGDIFPPDASKLRALLRDAA